MFLACHEHNEMKDHESKVILKRVYIVQND